MQALNIKNYINLDNSALQEIDIIIQRLSSLFLSIENREFQKACALEVCNLPSHLREYLTGIASNLRNEGYYIFRVFKSMITKLEIALFIGMFHGIILLI